MYTMDACSILGCNNSLIHLFHNSTVRVMNERVSGQCAYTILHLSDQVCNLLTEAEGLLGRYVLLFSSCLVYFIWYYYKSIVIYIA